MSYIKAFSELGKNNASIAGGKGASLGEMTQAGIPVPDGFVILASAFEKFLEETDLGVEIDAILHTVNKSEVRSVEHASEKIQHLILSAKMPAGISTDVQKHFDQLGTEYVAVRSSATAEDSASAAWAGQLESYLNTNADTLLENVQRCWASLFTPRAIFYRFEKDLHTTKISVAVVIQKMVNSELSGVAFSVHPITEDKNQLIIEAGYGLGEAIVAGQITPDSYVVEKEPRSVTDVNTNTQKKALYRATGGGNEWQDIVEPKASSQVLTSEQILQLAELVIRIEKHYAFPCDIEWVFENNTFYIVQSRPITTLDKVEGMQKYKKEDYLLVFWVQGVSVFVTDIHLDVYRELEVLYLIDRGTFKQYFTKKAYARALDRGLVFYSDKNTFDTYQKDLSTHCDTFKGFFEAQIEGKNTLSRQEVSAFFSHAQKLCGDYGKMNIEYTDKAFAHKDENRVIAENLARVAIFKDQVRAVMNMVLFEPDGYLTKLFVTLGKQFGISPAVLDNLTQREILALFESKRPDELTVLKRQTAFVESYDLDGVFEGKNAERVIQDFKDEAVYTDTIKGTTANMGKIVGKVKIIPVDYSDLARVNIEIEKMNQGDILVAETTAPELMVACKKAGAIVTDLGGLMSHAAIVSREFNIPCIVGTERASKILRDGDLVEVDANLGIVKVLSTENPTKSVLSENHLSLSEWFANAGVGDENLFRNEDNEKRERLKKLHQVLNLPFDAPTQFKACDIANETEPVKTFLTEHGQELCALRLIPITDGLPKLRMRGLTISEVTQTWFPKQQIDVSLYRADYMPHSNRTIWSTVFIVNQYGIFGEIIQGRHDQLTSGHYEKDTLRHTFSFDFKTQAWAISPQNKDAIEHLKLVVSHIKVDDTEKNKVLAETLSSSFHNNYLAGYFETVLSAEFGLWFIDYNRILGDLYKNTPLLTEISHASSNTIQGTTVYGAGKIRGTVVLLDLDPEHVPDLKHITDPVIVASYTLPQHLPLLKRAVAIITDEGGILSHSSIISRELKTPCIIGTRGATEILRDGDLIEIDTDRGLAEILSRKTP